MTSSDALTAAAEQANHGTPCEHFAIDVPWFVPRFLIALYLDVAKRVEQCRRTPLWAAILVCDCDDTMSLRLCGSHFATYEAGAVNCCGCGRPIRVAVSIPVWGR
jgi:hypothetical protein